jgi:hypothetical protein
MRILPACLIALLLFARSAFADPVPVPAAAVTAPAAKTEAPDIYDLGEGLGYLRVPRVADSLPLLDRALAKGDALIVDLRYAQAAEQDAPALALTLAQRKSPAPVFVLVSPQTPAVLATALAKLPTPTLTVGVADSIPRPAVVVAQPADLDRRAYDALDGGMPLEALITGKIEKERFDEAELVKEFENGNAHAAPPPEPDPTQKADAEKAPVLTDRVLQRAVHLHRTLTALKRS